MNTERGTACSHVAVTVQTEMRCSIAQVSVRSEEWDDINLAKHSVPASRALEDEGLATPCMAANVQKHSGTAATSQSSVQMKEESQELETSVLAVIFLIIIFQIKLTTSLLLVAISPTLGDLIQHRFKNIELFHSHVFGSEVQGFERDSRLVKVLQATLAVLAIHKLHRRTECNAKGLYRVPMSRMES
ncbi:hypothetical protein llap_12964 [Limosa lapponica baueri]|uniref:Uncharacterized protein n=1 Tax=Limosa lapponica baueri TaxID=1758121 RepID=A0A2I0TSL4_LIMLA|nr:hypothetical protein llap_12964 [Limosa lapponica baueri]